jgi:rubredoxin
MIKNMVSFFGDRRQFLKYVTGALVLLFAHLLPFPSNIVAGEKSPAKEEGKMKKYVCLLCGYVYDPAQGDPHNKIPPGTPFEKLPDYWVCPNCGAEKSEFKVWE